jgi:hypothetical protein
MSKNSLGVSVVRDRELIRIERASFPDLLARRGDLVPGLHGLLGHLELDLARLGYPLRSVKNLERDQVAPIVVIEDDTGLVLVTLGYPSVVLENHTESVGARVVVDLHSGLQYLEILLVRYAVTTSAGSRLMSTKTAIVLDGVVRHLSVDPTAETRHRKQMRPNPLAAWELRLGNLRVYFDIVSEPEPLVVVLAVGIKEGTVVRIGKRSIEL